MTRYVLDAPTLVHVLREGVPIDPSHRLVAPNAVRSQALQLLLDQVRAGALTDREALELHERMTALPMRLLGDRVSRSTAWRIARERDAPIALAEFVAVASLQADALVTVDPGLAALADGLVPVAPVAALLAG
jgi:predicted nucleic acid-binding protein